MTVSPREQREEGTWGTLEDCAGLLGGLRSHSEAPSRKAAQVLLHVEKLTELLWCMIKKE